MYIATARDNGLHATNSQSHDEAIRWFNQAVALCNYGSFPREKKKGNLGKSLRLLSFSFQEAGRFEEAKNAIDLSIMEDPTATGLIQSSVKYPSNFHC